MASSARDGKKRRSYDKEESGGTPLTRSDLEDIIGAVQSELQHNMDKMQCDVSESFAVAARKLDERSERRVAALEVTVAESSFAIQKLERDNARIWKEIEALQTDIAQAHESEPLRSHIEDPTIDRKVDATIIKLGAREMLGKGAVGTVASKWLQEANNDSSMCQLQGEDLAKKFIIKFSGNAQTADRRVRPALSSLRAADGAWQRFKCLSPANRESYLCIGPDKSPKQIKTELVGKKLLQAFQKAHRDRQLFLSSKEGVISHAWVPIARVVVDEWGPPHRGSLERAGCALAIHQQRGCHQFVSCIWQAPDRCCLAIGLRA